jgi:hypothetical protein
MPAADREWLEQQTRARCAERVTTPTEEQIREAAALVADLYEVAAAYGVDVGLVDGVTSFIDIGVDAIRARDHRKSATTH